MIVLSHPTGNTFSRALLGALEGENLLARFYTTLAVQPQDWPVRLMPSRVRRQIERRSYPVPPERVSRFPYREAVRLAASRLGMRRLVRHETGWASLDRVYAALDREVARALTSARDSGLTGVYCYEDCALQTFRAAKERGLACFYDLPISYWQTSRRLLEEEVQRWPEWGRTLGGTRDSAAKLERKTQELALADVVITPSRFVQDSLPPAMTASKVCRVVEFGSPVTALPPSERDEDPKRPLRVLFAGSMTQRKGLADLFAAMKLLKRTDVELVVMGSLAAPQEFYRRQYADFRYEAPRPHGDVLRLMQSCDLLALPSIVEGRALVQQEAMACGLPLIVTANAGGEDLVDDQETGFLVPIRRPEAIAEKINWFADHREELPRMRARAADKAAEYTWERYGARIIETIRAVFEKEHHEYIG